MYHYYVEFWDELDQKNRSDSGLTWGATDGDAANRVVEYYGLENIPPDWIKAVSQWDNYEIPLRGYILQKLNKMKL